jgi:hypothetical protein
MTDMSDKILALLALSALTGFIAVLLTFVQEPDLIIVSAGCVALAVYDFYRELFRSKNGG